MPIIKAYGGNLPMNTVLFILIVILAMFIQALVGFGGNPIAMPFGILLVGVGVAKPVMTILACLSGILVMITDFKYINWKELFKMTSVMLVGMALGIWAFGALSLHFLLIAYAAVVLAIGLKKLLFPSKRDAPVVIQAAALGIAGIMQGLFVSGGSFLAVYSVARLKDKREFRATSNAVWAVLNVVLIISYLFDGTLTNEVLITCGICLIPVFFSTWIAGLLCKHINQQVFLKITYLILIASGAVLLISNLRL